MPSEEWQAVRNVAMLRLALERVLALGQEAFQAHGALERWRDPPCTDMERTQCRWLQAIAQQLEEGP